MNGHDHSVAASLPSSTQALRHYYHIGLTSTKSLGWLYTTAAVLLSLLILEQSVYRYKKRHLPGAKWTIPIIGKFADSLHPTMDGYKRQWDLGALSAISVFNIFIVMAASNEYARKILNSPQYAQPCIVASGQAILEPRNWVFLTGKQHVDYRRGLNALFTRKALGMYLTIQDAITRKHFAKWLEESAKNASAQPIMQTARFLNMDTSLNVFCGNHIPEHAAKEINDKYWAITKALELVNFPIAVPGTKVYRAIQARKVAMYWLEQAAHKSKIAMANGAVPQCMLDEWVMLLKDPAYKGRRDFSDHEMAMVLFSFLFASQDAMSSGLIYGFQHMVDHPEVLAKVREEQERVRQGDYEKPMTYDMLQEMPYLQAFVRESLRVKPPVLMIPYVATKPFPISPDYTAPAGSMVIPSFFNSMHDPEVFPDPETLNPDRWLDPNGSANQNPKNYIVFGSGPHRCIGIEYAMMNIALVLSTASVLFDIEHEMTPTSDKVQIVATLFPQDGCRLKFTRRNRA